MVGFSWYICGEISAIFLSMSPQAHKIAEFGPLNSPTLCSKCIQTSLFGVASQPNSDWAIFFETDTLTGPETCTVNVQRHHKMLNMFVIPQMQQRNCLHQTTFMQDGALLQIGVKVKQLLCQAVGGVSNLSILKNNMP